MSDIGNIDVWSSWHVIDDNLLSTIELRNSNGALLGLEISPRAVMLRQPEDDRLVHCQLHLDTTKLTGYYLQGVAVTSEARNVEVYYDNGEYIGTSGRSLLNNTADDASCVVCCCTFELDNMINKLTLKLLSLRGKNQIKVTKISLRLMENYGRGEEQEQTNTMYYNPALLTMVHNLPPVVQSIVNELHHGSSSGDLKGSPSDGMNKLIAMLREARIAKEEEQRKTEKEENEEVENDKKESNKRESEETREPLPIVTNDNPLLALEMKLKQLFTEQLSLLEQKIETKLNNLVKRLDNLESINK